MCVYIIVLIFCSYFVPLQAMHGRAYCVFTVSHRPNVLCQHGLIRSAGESVTQMQWRTWTFPRPVAESITDVLRHCTVLPKLAVIIRSCWLPLFGHIVCMDDNADAECLLSERLEKTTRTFLHHVAQHRPTGSETPRPYAPGSSRFDLEPPSVEDDVNIWRYTILELHARNDADDTQSYCSLVYFYCSHILVERMIVRARWQIV